LNNYIELIKTLTLVTGARMMYEASRPQKPSSSNPEPSNSSPDPQPDLWSGYRQKYRQWSRKAVRKYAQAQEKRWRAWEEAMRQ